MTKKFKVAICQMMVTDNKKTNIDTAVRMIEESALTAVDFVVLPEMFNCPYDINLFEKFAEKEEDGETIFAVSKIAKEKGIYIIAGSIPEKENNRIYNTSFIFGRDGKVIAKHRKIHLFDIDVKDKIIFMESKILSPGDKITIFDTEFGKIGVGICYDVRFPEIFRKMSLDGVIAVFLPGAFNMVTGPAHWEITLRARALDNQIYLIGAAPARNTDASYVSYANSIAVNPWGEIIVKCGIKEEISFCNIDLDYLEKVRQELPLLKHRRPNLY